MTPPLYPLLILVTDIGDAACLLAITLAGSLYLLSRGAWRALVFLAAAFLLSALLVSLAKLAFLGCRSYFHCSGIHSPSGHAALSAAVFWAYAILMRGRLEAGRRFLPALILSLLVAAVAISRVWLDYHSEAEVATGLLSGAAGLCIAYFLVLRGKAWGAFDAYALALWAIVAAFLAYGMHLSGENLIHMLALRIHGHLPLCS